VLTGGCLRPVKGTAAPGTGAGGNGGPKSVGREDSFLPISSHSALSRVVRVLARDLAAALSRDDIRWGPRRAKKIVVTFRNAGGRSIVNPRGASAKTDDEEWADGKRHGHTAPMPSAAYGNAGKKRMRGAESVHSSNSSNFAGDDRTLDEAAEAIATVTLEVLNKYLAAGSFSINLLNLSACDFEPAVSHSAPLKAERIGVSTSSTQEVSEQQLQYRRTYTGAGEHNAISKAEERKRREECASSSSHVASVASPPAFSSARGVPAFTPPCEWVCSTCTLINGSKSRQCLACGEKA